MNADTANAIANMLPAASPDSLLGAVFMCSVVLGAALLYSLSIERRL